MKIRKFSDDAFIGLHQELAQIKYRDKDVSLNLAFPPHGLIIKLPGEQFHIPFESIIEDFFLRYEKKEDFSLIRGSDL